MASGLVFYFLAQTRYIHFMARPLRILYEGAVYRVTSRGNARQDIFLDDKDRLKFLEMLAEAVERYHWISHAYCRTTTICWWRPPWPTSPKACGN